MSLPLNTGILAYVGTFGAMVLIAANPYINTGNLAYIGIDGGLLLNPRAQDNSLVIIIS